jgi:extracellular elastinolytic metalloproteinase
MRSETREARTRASIPAGGVRVLLCCLALTGVWLVRVAGQPPATRPLPDDARNFDARTAIDQAAPVAPLNSQSDAVQRLAQEIPALAVTYDDRLGVTRTLVNQQGYLTAEAPGREPLDIASDFVKANLDLLGLDAADLDDYELTDLVANRATGSTHIYLRQRHQGLPVYNAQLQVNVNRDGRILSVNNQFVANLAAAVNQTTPALGAGEAVASAATQVRIPAAGPPGLVDVSGGAEPVFTVDATGISAEPIKARLMLLPIRRGVVRLVWNFQIHTLDSQHAYDFTVDAASGAVWTRFDWVAADQYQVYQRPVESPNHTSPVPPADGRTIQVDPAHGVASPYAWHDTNGAAGAEYTITRGNNAHAYEDSNNDGLPPASEVDCGPSLLCNFAINLAVAPAEYIPAAVTNLFYWNNVIHDVQYQYGFTEAAGNFQVNNYGRGGLGNDDVRAEALDGGSINNANMLTPPDGQRPRMQMFVWTAAEPDRTSDLDNGIIVHEYGHGISNRLVGGPSNVSCLGNTQQPGEGLSDWWGLVYTARVGDTGAMGRGMGTYVLNQPTTGPGIRTQRYSTDPAINTWTYESINGAAVPHGVGSVWAQAMWEVYWALVGRHGFDANLYNAAAGAGNHRAMLYMNQGLMNSPCSPTFTDVRNGILQAAIDNYGGQDLCLMWNSFAQFGLGVNAVSGGPSSTAPTNGFGTPFFCLPAPPPSISIADVSVGEAAGNASFNVSLSGARPYPVQVNYSTADFTAMNAVGSVTYSNAAPITMPIGGVASPYPSSITVPTAPAGVTGVRVTLNGFSHTFPWDLNMLLVGPGGQRVLLMSQVPIFSAVSNLTVTFSDFGPPIQNPFTSGTYRPTRGGSYDYLPPPAPAAPHGTTLSQFIPLNPVGTWSLYIFDVYSPADGGAISGGWSVTFLTGDYVPTAGVLTFAPGETNKPISVPIINDTAGEPTETFFMNLSGPANATIADAQAIGTILDNDGGPPPPPPNPLGDLAVDFGGSGLWARYNPTGAATWTPLHGLNPSAIAAANLDGNSLRDLVVNFPTYGVFAYMNNATWVHLHPFDASDIETGDLDGNGQDDVIVDFPGIGVWARMNGASWVQLHPFNVTSMATGNIDGDAGGRADLIVNFPGNGVWAWMNHTSWTQLHRVAGANIQTGDIDGNGRADVVLDLASLGVWMFFNNANWVPLMGANSAGITVGNIDGDLFNKADVVVSFSGFGVWVWMNNSVWVQLHNLNAPVMANGDLDNNGRSDVLMVFPGFGLFAFMNNTSYVHIHPMAAEAVVVGRFDGN